jgi:phospholipid/cholesterol/gamma-HCH transport system permease protein
LTEQSSFIEPAQDGTLTLKGEWTIFHAASIQAAVSDALKSASPQALDASGIEKLDTAGAWQLKRLVEASPRGTTLNARQQVLMDFLPQRFEEPLPRPRPKLVRTAFATLGQKTEDGIEFLFTLFSFIGQVSIRFGYNLLHPRHMRLPSIVRHIQEAGLSALPIIGLLAILMSMVIAYQAALQLQKFGASMFTIDLTVISLLREMGVLVTAIMIAGRSGSAFAAEIGVMKLREEVDALQTIGLDPIEILVLPRLIALMIVLPLLTFLADIMGLFGGALMSITLLDIPLDQYIHRVSQVGTPMMFFVGIIKAPVFAFLIAIIGTYQGLMVSGSAESVGRLTTVAVVQSIFMVILADAFFSIVFAKLGL